MPGKREAIFQIREPKLTHAAEKKSDGGVARILRRSRRQSDRGIHPGGVNICEHLELLGEDECKERVNRPSHTDGRFRATLSEYVASSMRHTSLARPSICISEP